MGCKKDKKYANGGIADLLKQYGMTEDMSDEMKKDVKKLYGEDVSPEKMKQFKDEYEEDYKKDRFKKLKQKMAKK